MEYNARVPHIMNTTLSSKSLKRFSENKSGKFIVVSKFMDLYNKEREDIVNTLHSMLIPEKFQVQGNVVRNFYIAGNIFEYPLIYVEMDISGYANVQDYDLVYKKEIRVQLPMILKRNLTEELLISFANKQSYPFTRFIICADTTFLSSIKSFNDKKYSVASAIFPESIKNFPVANSVKIVGSVNQFVLLEAEIDLKGFAK